MLTKYIAKGGVTLRVYKETIEDKRAFVKEVLSSLLVINNTGWYGAEYEHLQGQGEFVYLLAKNGVRGCKIDVTADSISAIVLDVYKNI